jgi:hypothetical protein
MESERWCLVVVVVVPAAAAAALRALRGRRGLGGRCTVLELQLGHVLGVQQRDVAVSAEDHLLQGERNVADPFGKVGLAQEVIPQLLGPEQLGPGAVRLIGEVEGRAEASERAEILVDDLLEDVDGR